MILPRAGSIIRLAVLGHVDLTIMVINHVITTESNPTVELAIDRGYSIRSVLNSTSFLTMEDYAVTIMYQYYISHLHKYNT